MIIKKRQTIKWDDIDRRGGGEKNSFLCLLDRFNIFKI